MRKLLLALPLLALGACALNDQGQPSGQLSPAACANLRSAVALAKLNGKTSIKLGDNVLTVEQVELNLAVLCPAE
jgi:hypothetical protein